MKEHNLNGIFVKDSETSGKPLIFIHAFPLCNRMWDKQTDYFEKSYRVITYDVRGLGYSTEIKSWHFTIEEYADDLFMIMEEMEIQLPVICGLSMGGYIAQRAVIRAQKKFSGVILADTRAERDDNKGLSGRAAAIKTIKSGERDKFVSEFTKKLLGKDAYSNDETRAFVELMISWQKDDGINGALLAMASRQDNVESLKEITIPSLIICGSEDELTPITYSQTMKEHLPNSTLKIIENAGHLSNLEKPAEFNSAVESFLKSINY